MPRPNPSATAPPPGAVFVAYLRDSGGDGQDLSTTEQSLAIQRYCTERGYTLLSLYIDDATPGSTVIGRANFNSMIHDLRAGRYPGLSGVIIWSYSRFSRDVDDAQYYKSDLRRRGYLILSISDPVPDGAIGRFIENAIDWRNASYLETLSKDVKLGLYHLVETIGAVPGTPPRGFRRVPITLPDRRDGQPHIVHRWEPDPNCIDRIRRAYELRANGASYATIARETGLYKSKNSWVHFFANRLYMGELHYGQTIIPNYCEAIVDPITWQNAQPKPSSPSHASPTHHPRRKRSTYLLSGIAYCPCGAPLSGSTVTHKTKHWDKRYYTCSRRSRTHNADCQARLIPAADIESNIINYLANEILTLVGLQAIANELLTTSTDTLAALRKTLNNQNTRITQLQRQISNIINAIRDIGHSPALSADLKRLETDLSSLTAERNNTSNAIRDIENIPSDDELNRVIKQMRPALLSGETDLIRSVIQRLISRIIAERLDSTVQTQLTLLLPTGMSHRGVAVRSQQFTLAKPRTPPQTSTSSRRSQSS